MEQRADERKLAAWALAVKERDGWKDRKTGQRVKRTEIALDPTSAHAHHIASRADEAVRYDIRNGLCLSFATHDAVERNRLRIVGTKFFIKHGKRYIDGTHQVRFKEVV